MAVREDIYNKIRESIIYGELVQGEKLSEVDLAKKLGVSRTPIREAFRQLETEGLINILLNRGAYVTKLPYGEVEEIYTMIGLLESYAAGLAAEKIKKTEIDKLKRLYDKMFFVASRKKYYDYINNNINFHHLITSLGGNNNLTKTVKELRVRIYRYRLTSVTIPGYINVYVSQHEKVVNAIIRHNSTLAKKYMEEHVNFVKKVLVDFLKESINF
jgi:DNA-binding GntR family transcriptional regulator